MRLDYDQDRFNGDLAVCYHGAAGFSGRRELLEDAEKQLAAEVGAGTIAGKAVKTGMLASYLDDIAKADATSRPEGYSKWGDVGCQRVDLMARVLEAKASSAALSDSRKAAARRAAEYVRQAIGEAKGESRHPVPRGPYGKGSFAGAHPRLVLCHVEDGRFVTSKNLIPIEPGTYFGRAPHAATDEPQVPPLELIQGPFEVDLPFQGIVFKMKACTYRQGGRELNAFIVLEKPFSYKFSRLHVQFLFEDGQWFISRPPGTPERDLVQVHAATPARKMPGMKSGGWQRLEVSPASGAVCKISTGTFICVGEILQYGVLLATDK